MSFWDSIAQRDNFKRLPEAFEEAAYRIIAEQVLYHADKSSRATYWIVEQYEREFRQTLDKIGVDLIVNRERRYIVGIPRHSSYYSASVAVTLTALVLRRLFDEFARQGNLTEDGEVFIDLIDFEEKFRLVTHRQLPSRTELEQIMRVLRRWGIARKTTDDEYVGESATPYAVVIRPAIIDVLGETALARLERWENSAKPNVLDDQEQSHEMFMNDEIEPDIESSENHL